VWGVVWLRSPKSDSGRETPDIARFWFLQHDPTLFESDGFQLPEVFNIKWPHYETSVIDSVGQKLATYRWMPKETPKCAVAK
jgi:hypothetical protein